MSRDDQGQAGARQVQSASFLFNAREASHRRGVQRNQPKVSILVQQDQERQDGRLEVTVGPVCVDSKSQNSHIFQNNSP